MKVTMRRHSSLRNTGWWTLSLLASLAAGPAFAGTGNLPAPGEVLMTDPEVGEQRPTEEPPVLATAFGYQTDTQATILVKTFDPRTGTILYEHSFDLPGSQDSAGQDEKETDKPLGDLVLAGGARVAEGEGALKLSLRVYEAETGRYLWNAQLTITLESEENVETLVSSSRRPMARMWRTASTPNSSDKLLENPLFLVRAVDPATETVRWEDRFTGKDWTGGKVERLRYRQAADEAEPPLEALKQKFDFHVWMQDQGSGDLLWENTSSLLIQPTEASSQDEEPLGKLLPLWPLDADRTQTTPELL
jgi:hypothetical protein